MRALLDTHVFLWAIDQYEKLSGAARDLIEDSSSDLLLSSASIWEIMLKAARGKVLPGLAPEECIRFLRDHLKRLNTTVLAIEASHAFATARLPLIHKDPFDRLLIAQAKAENVALVTGDRNIIAYPVRTIW